MKKAIFIIFVFWSLMGAIFPGSRTIHFKHISLDEGLSQNTIFSIFQDSKGFMWFATQDGLNKYNGYNFTVYKPEPDNPNSLSHNQINAICEDKSCMIWVGTNSGGLNRFDPKKEIFYRYRIDVNDPNCLHSAVINTIYLDNSGALWIGTNGGGLSLLIPKPGEKERFIHYGKVPGDPYNLGSNFISSVAEDMFGVLWIGTFNDGLKKFDRQKKKFTHFRRLANDPQSLSLNSVSKVYEDRSGMLWIGTNGGGLNLLDRKTGKFSCFQRKSNNPGSLSSDFVTTIFEDRSGVLWIGTDGGGINRFDRRTETFTRYMRAALDPCSLSHNSVASIYEDRSRILWIGTRGGGLNKFDREDKFEHYKADPNNPNSLSDNFVYAIYEDRFGILWIGTNGYGLDKFDRKNGTFTHYRRISTDPWSLGSNIIRSIYEDQTGVLWIGTDGGGLNKFSRETETFSHYRRIAKDPNSLSSNNVRTIYEDRSGILWIGTYGGGFNKFNRETGRFTPYRRIADNPNSLSDDLVYIIYEASTEPGVLWIGTFNGGLNRFNTLEETFTRYEANQDDSHSLSSNSVTSIYEDHAGRLWIGTYGGGLNKMLCKQGETPKFVHYTEKNGLCNNSIYGILEDPDGHLWMSTNKGLSRFDPKTEAFKNYNARDGLQGNEFNGGAYFKSKSDEMFFGGLNGFNAFYPFHVKDNPHKPSVVITGFKIFNESVGIGGDSPLQQSITWTNELLLSYKQDAFSFEFAALDFTIPENNNYAYMMDGLEKNWNYTDSGKRFASYTNIAPGEYIFRVKGSNNDGTWNKKGTSIRIIITPPFWATWRFRIFLLLLVMGLVLVWYRKRLKNVRLKIELQTARNAQMSIMPQSDPEIEGFSISGVCVPANEVGGDFFDYIWMNEEKTKLGIAIGDVSGKAMKSAMTAVMTSGMIYLKAYETNSVKEIMRRVNRPLYFKTEKKVFTALCLASLDIRTKEITFTNAGLNEPLLKSAESVSRLKGVGNKLPLGVKVDSVYLEKKQQLKPEEVLVFFTDGITEAKNPVNEFYGHDALKTLLEKMDTSLLTAKEIKEKIIADAKHFSEGASQHDDMTIVVVKVGPLTKK